MSVPDDTVPGDDARHANVRNGTVRDVNAAGADAAFDATLSIDELLDTDLLAALRRLECSDPSRPRLGKAVRLADEVVRLSQSVSLGFGGRSLVSLERVAGPRPWRLHGHHPGLFGSNGPLPLHLTEEADRRARHHADPTTREFIDLFNHRALALFYRAWADAEPAIAGDRPDENPFADMLGALGGVVEAESRERDALPDALRQGSAMWFGPAARSPDGLRALLRRHLRMDGRVVELSGGWVRIPEASRFALGGRARRDRARLGERLLGRRGWCANGAFRLVVRTPTRAAFDALSRAGRALDVLDDVVRAYVGDELAWELELELPAAEARSAVLGRTTGPAGRLGRDAWLSPARGGPCRLRLDGARRRRIRRAARSDETSQAPASSDDAWWDDVPTKRAHPRDTRPDDTPLDDAPPNDAQPEDTRADAGRPDEASSHEASADTARPDDAVPAVTVRREPEPEPDPDPDPDLPSDGTTTRVNRKPEP